MDQEKHIEYLVVSWLLGEIPYPQIQKAVCGTEDIYFRKQTLGISSEREQLNSHIKI